MTIEEREQSFKLSIHRMIGFDSKMREEFFQYWSERNPSGTKMKFEYEKTWDLKRRLTRWQGNNFNKQFSTHKTMIMEPKSEIKEVVELDRIIQHYSLHPTSVPFDEFGKYYEFLKEQKLIRKLNQFEINSIKQSYPDDNYKCRCACVQLTIQGYVDSGFTFAKVFELRQKLSDKRV